MKMLSVAVDEKFASAIDNCIKATGAYSSRSEFMKDSLRKNLEQAERLEWRKRFEEDTEKLAALARKRGYKGGFPSQEQRDKWAVEYLKEKGLM
jgi:Arc/MetJ-type ribon-helix-helix transcriptional regulator